MLAKDDLEHPVPEQWRPTFQQIVDAFVAGDFGLRRHRIDRVEAVDPATAEHIAANIFAYGDALAPLSEETWRSSIYRWMDGYWYVLVDLSTASEAVSDLTLHANVHGDPESHFEIESVHVP